MIPHQRLQVRTAAAAAALLLLLHSASSLAPLARQRTFRSRSRIQSIKTRSDVVYRRVALRPRKYPSGPSLSTTSLSLLVDVPDGFFTFTFPVLGILLSISKSFARVRMEERAWEQRLGEGRLEILQRDPTLTELDLRRAQAAQEWSAYGVSSSSRSSQQVTEQEYRRQDDTLYERRRQDDTLYERRQGPRVSVLDRNENDDDEAETSDAFQTKQRYIMTEEEIKAFELEFGIAYDPYYDDPYTVDDLPDGKCEIDKRYGDRIYPNGEIFYKDGQTGLYYRQGSKPRNINFFG
jgi:hypothetical protein